MSERAFDIEKRSLDIIDSEVGSHEYNDMQWTIVRRVIHATADFDFATGKGKIVFHPKALDSTFAAIQNGCNIVTDVDMVLAALNKKSLKELGLRAWCHISDSTVADEARKVGMTRSEMAMRYAAKQIDGGIVVIGNAPTALYEVIRMAKGGITTPAIVVGIPVGFVSAQESKEELARQDVPFITNSGRKGGSPAAASILNAIMLLYQSKKSSA
ncbi:MAG: precorrin-8X methylmutase [Nitrososphaera sp.]|nr:precorrin-8X methylmutase [Nitrososphaera sp.]